METQRHDIRSGGTVLSLAVVGLVAVVPEQAIRVSIQDGLRVGRLLLGVVVKSQMIARIAFPCLTTRINGWFHRVRVFRAVSAVDS